MSTFVDMKANSCLPFRSKYSYMKYLNFQKLFILA